MNNENTKWVLNRHWTGYWSAARFTIRV